uniref:Uncharacterized protein n=1 Tax=Rhizophora mucronata TaxID=61149 RepID=A0A2P2MXP0_RHIMU
MPENKLKLSLWSREVSHNISFLITFFITTEILIYDNSV